MTQKCSLIAVLEIFFKEPTQIHFIKEIGKKINLAPTSVKNNTEALLKEELIKKINSKPFNGLIANRENQKFLDYKQVYNLFSLIQLKEEIINKIGPKTIILFGSYQRGEDIENSDIDVLIISKIKKNLNLSIFEKNLSRKIHLTFADNLEKLEKGIKENVKNGWVIHGRI